ncbi:hypothetical protein ACLB2K_073284 [Fragaria x ananassa]
MEPSCAGSRKRPTRSSRAPAKIQSLDHDILCIIFSFLDFFDLARCSVVCKTWSGIINKSKLLEALYYKKWQMGLVGAESRSGGCPEKSLNVYLEEMALQHHRVALEQGRVHVDHWRAHSVGYCLLSLHSHFVCFLFISCLAVLSLNSAAFVVVVVNVMSRHCKWERGI